MDKNQVAIERYKQIQTQGALDAYKYTCHYLTIKGDIPYSHGSGVFVKLGDLHFLFTAAHVVEGMFDKIYISTGKNSLVHLGGTWVMNLLGDSKERATDKLDFAILKLHEKSVKDAEAQYEFLDHLQIGLNHDLKNFPFYTAVGFPSSQNKRNPKSGVFISMPFIFTTLPSQQKAYSQLKCDPNKNIIVEYDKNRVFDNNNKKRIVGPDAYGMSGGGLWCIEPKITLDESEVSKQLVGILTEWPIKNRKVWIATRIDLYIQAIQNKFGIHP